jgi:hypothetical protein
MTTGELTTSTKTRIKAKGLEKLTIEVPKNYLGPHNLRLEIETLKIVLTEAVNLLVQHTSLGERRAVTHFQTVADDSPPAAFTDRKRRIGASGG